MTRNLIITSLIIHCAWLITAIMAYEIGWQKGSTYQGRVSWAAGVNVCAGGPKWCQEMQPYAKAILDEPRQDIRWPTKVRIIVEDTITKVIGEGE